MEEHGLPRFQLSAQKGIGDKSLILTRRELCYRTLPLLIFEQHKIPLVGMPAGMLIEPKAVSLRQRLAAAQVQPGLLPEIL